MRLIARLTCILVALAAVLEVIFPPLATTAENALFVNMTQHLILMAVAAPLMVMSGALASLESLSVTFELTRPRNALLIFLATFLLWHWPGITELGERTRLIGLVEGLSLFAAAWLFWTSALSDRHHMMSNRARFIYVLFAAAASDFIVLWLTYGCALFGKLIHNSAFRIPIKMECPDFFALMMWMPANLVFVAIAISLGTRTATNAELDIIEYVPPDFEAAQRLTSRTLPKAA